MSSQATLQEGWIFFLKPKIFIIIDFSRDHVKNKAMKPRGHLHLHAAILNPYFSHGCTMYSI